MNAEIMLGEIAIIVMGQSPTGETCNTDGVGLPLLNGPTEFSSKHPYPCQYTIDAKKLSKKDDLLFCVRGSTTGKMNWSDQIYAIGRGIAAIRGKNGYPNTFIRAVIEFKLESLLVRATGSTFPNVSSDLLNKLKLPFISALQAQKIAGILDPLNEKIDLLRQTNTTLEAIAQALFKSWFIDFDPVRAKAEGREPEGIDAETAALFPDSFEESELQIVPKGWRLKKLGDITYVKGGFAYKSSAFCEAGFPVVKIKNIVGDGTVNLENTVHIDKLLAKKTGKFELQDGDIVIAMTGATIGKTGIIVTNDFVAPYLNQRVAKFESKFQGYRYNWFVYVAFQNESISKQIVDIASGSAQANISTTGIESVRIVLPDQHDLLLLFNQSVNNLFLSWIENQKQIKSLTQLRDTLLPQLISGRICISLKLALDTNVINHFHEAGISGKELRQIFSDKKMTPYISPYVTYELARLFLKNENKAKNLFSFLIQLNPKFTPSRDNLYKLELDKLQGIENTSFDANEDFSDAIMTRIKRYSEGIIDEPPELAEFISDRQSSWIIARKEWASTDISRKKIIKTKYQNDFNLYMDNIYTKLINNNEEYIDVFRRIITLSTDNMVVLSNDEILLIAKNPNNYPVFSTSVRHHAYLGFLADQQKEPPSEDRFTDGLIMIEYSYCDIFLSNDNNLINKHGKYINPHMKLMTVQEIIQ